MQNRRRHHRHRPQILSIRRVTGAVLSLTAFTSILGVGLLIHKIDQMNQHLPSVARLWDSYASSSPSMVYDRDGTVVATLGASSAPVALSEIAPSVATAVIAIEDHRFYQNQGYDLKSIARSAYVDLKAGGRPVQGASTITEQLAKNLYLSDQKSLNRKIDEFLLGIKLYHHYSKAQILDLYLNTVYFGQGAKGIRAAAKVYFNTTPSHLTLNEATLLAGLPQSPSQYDPYIHPQAAQVRRDQVIDAMERYHDLTAQRAAQLRRQPISLTPGHHPTSQAPYPDPWYLDQVIRVLLEKGFSLQDIFHGGLHIHTALRPRVYQLAQAQVQYWMNRNFGRAHHPYAYHQAAVVVENPHNGHIWAIIGGRQYLGFLSPDLAIDALRSTGSAIKPILDYAPALARGYTENSVIQDVPRYRHVHHQAFWPQNDNLLYRGYMSLADALALSNNNVAVQLFAQIGPHYAIHYANQQFGMHLGKNAGYRTPPLGLALGVDTNLMTLTQAYGAIDNGGIRLSPIVVTRVTRDHHVLYQSPRSSHRALSADQAFILTQMMKGVLQSQPLRGIGPDAFPTGAALGIHRPAAAKSGTNNNEEDAWFLGFEPQMLVGVWEGDRIGEVPQPYTNSGAGPAYGAVSAGPIWKGIMVSVNRTLPIPKRRFEVPPGVIYQQHISATSGLLASRYTPKRDQRGGWYVQGTVPKRRDPTWYPITVSRAHPSQLWQPGCGAFRNRIALRRESAWHQGIPKPWDARYWAPTAQCRPHAANLPSAPHE